MTLESFDTFGTLMPTEILRTDVVTLYVTKYIRTTSPDIVLVQQITMRQDVVTSYDVPHCVAELSPLPAEYSVAVRLRQKPGFELSWVTISEDPTNGKSVLTIDASAETVGIYLLYLESYDDLLSHKPTLLEEEIIEIEVTNYIRSPVLQAYELIT